MDQQQIEQLQFDYNVLQENYQNLQADYAEAQDQLRSFEPAERLLCARKVCETLAEFYVNGEFYGDPVTMRNLMRWMELEPIDARQNP